MKESIGTRIQKYRKAKNLTQEELAQSLGITSQAVSKWETDTSCPDISLLPQLCRILGITADELLAGRTETVRLVPKEDRRSLDSLTLRIYVITVRGDKVKVNLPMALVKASMEMGVDISSSVSGTEAVRTVDLQKILELAEQGALGKLMEIETSRGDLVEVVVE